jgi:hypothetical protein
VGRDPGRDDVGHGGGRDEDWAELAGGEGFQGAEAGFEFGGGYAALAVEAAEKIFGGRLPLLRVAFGAAGNEIAVGIGPAADLRDDVVEAARAGSELAQAIEAQATVPRVNGIAPGFPLQEIHLLEVHWTGRGSAGRGSSHGSLGDGGAYLLRQKDFDPVASLGAVDQA